MSMEQLEKLAAEQGYELVPVQTPSDIIGNHAASMHMSAQLMITPSEKGGIPDEEARQSMRIVRAYIDTILAGEIPNPADVYCKAMETTTNTGEHDENE